MKKLLTLILVLLIASILSSVIPNNFGNAQSTPTKYKISGYVKDSNGSGIAGANIIFNVPSIVPSVYSDSSGYYEIFAPAGTYHINVWPPYDTNYINYDEPGFVVGSDITKNITMYSGYKVSGYISDSSGTPVIGAVVALNNFGSGWFSNNMGYYFLSVPAGTYTINAHPRTGYNYSGPTTDFPTYYEYNFIVNSNRIKNITVGTKTKISGYVLDANGNGLAGAEIIFGLPEIVPSVYTDYSGYYVIYAPAGTYHLNVWPPFDSNYISYDQPVFSVGTSDIIKNITLSSGYKVSGYLTDTSGTPIRGALVSLNQFHCGWYSNDTGYYFVTAPPGTYTLKIQPKTGPSFPTYTEGNFIVTQDVSKFFVLASSSNTSTPTNENQKIFEVQSNSTVTDLAFNSNSLKLSFTISGSSGTTGYTKATIAKTLVPTVTGFSVALDGKNLNFSVSSISGYWILEFSYSHSTHQVTINLANDATESPAPISIIPEFSPWFVLVLGVVLTSVAFALVRKKLNPSHKTIR